MSQLLINDYLKQLDLIKKVSGSQRETILRGAPSESWAYKLGNRCAIDWVLDQHKEKKPKDPTIRGCFDTYRFVDHKDEAVELLASVTTVSVETVTIIEAMKGAAR
jgi:predicted helicase